jgi:hypothetical protein
MLRTDDSGLRPLLSGENITVKKEISAIAGWLNFFPEIQYHRFVAPANAGVQCLWVSYKSLGDSLRSPLLGRPSDVLRASRYVRFSPGRRQYQASRQIVVRFPRTAVGLRRNDDKAICV